MTNTSRKNDFCTPDSVPCVQDGCNIRTKKFSTIPFLLLNISAQHICSFDFMHVKHLAISLELSKTFTAEATCLALW